MNGIRGPIVVLAAASCFVVMGAMPWSAPAEPAGRNATRVTLARRTGDGPYGHSAYSFRHASQELDEHRNEVDLIFNTCGNLHVSASSAANRVAGVPQRKLEDVAAFPDDGWSTECFKPVKSGVYVMQIEDARQRLAVAFRILDAKDDKLVLEWIPFAERPGAAHGTLGTCGGPHGCK